MKYRKKRNVDIVTRQSVVLVAFFLQTFARTPTRTTETAYRKVARVAISAVMRKTAFR